MAAACEHGADCHTGLEPSMASAPEASRAWLLIEHPGPWPHEAADAAQPTPLAALVQSAEEFGVRVHLIRRPGRRQAGDVRSVSLGWTAGDTPWLRYAQVSASAPELTERDLKELAAGVMPSFGFVWDDPLYLVCTHGKRNVCCARLGGPLAQALAARHPGPVWETTHVGADSPPTWCSCRTGCTTDRSPWPPPRSTRTSAARLWSTGTGDGRASPRRSRRPSTRGWRRAGRCRSA